MVPFFAIYFANPNTFGVLQDSLEDLFPRSMTDEDVVSS